MIHIVVSKTGSKFTDSHVNLLKNSIQKHYKKPFTFHTVEKEEFLYAFNKVQAFQDNFLNIKKGERIVVMDLDIHVISDPSPVFDAELGCNTIGMFHKWWQYPYKSCFIWGGIYIFTSGYTQKIYDRLKSNPEYYYSRYSKLYDYKFRKDIDLPIRGEQDFVLESASIYNYNINLFPSFYAETIQPEVEEGRIDTQEALENPDNLPKDRLRKHFGIKSLNPDRVGLIFNHYSGYVDKYIEKYGI